MGQQATGQYAANAVHAMRTVQLNTLTLSRMADQKASILMGATFLVFSITVSRSLTGAMPTSLGLLALFSFLSSLCAVIAVLPSVKAPRPVERPNLLFFGHFAHMEEERWTADLLHELEDDEAIFRMMAHDIYQNGQVLQKRKYRFLSLAYRIFVAGLFVTMLAYALEFARG